MRYILYNTGYFMKETRTIIKTHLLSNLFSLFSTALIFFVVAMVISGWWIGNQLVSAIEEEAEISVYYSEMMQAGEAAKLAEQIKGVEGVLEVRLVDQAEAYSRMEKILGKEAKVLEFFDDNPFNPFIEAKIDMQEMEAVLAKVRLASGVEHIRDNREVLDRLKDISGVLKLLGYLVITAIAATTLVIIAHIIRQGIYNNREQIETMRLLGAPEGFIAVPFLLSGLVVTVGGGALASVLTVVVMKYIYAGVTGPLPFIPMPPQDAMAAAAVGLVMFLSMVLGIFGGIFGLSSARRG